MSAPVTEAHRAITEIVCELLDSEEMVGPSPAERAAQLIADSEAKATERLRAEVERLRECCDQTSTLCGKFITEDDGTDLIPNSARIANALTRLEARAELAEAELADIRALANRRNKRDHSQDTTHQLVAALDQALDIAQAELATERARIADLVADLNDACITLTSAEEDCDDYAMRNTRFKLTAVREVLLQHIPNAAMKEGA